jgi:hypothetical protein
VWTLVDPHGQLVMRDWSGGAYMDSDFVDRTVRLRRVRVANMNNSSTKNGEFLPGRNGTIVALAPHAVMQKWWMGQ